LKKLVEMISKSKIEERPLEPLPDSEQKDHVTTSCQTIGNTIVSGSASPRFLSDAFNELFTYRTPKAIVDFIKSEQTKCIIGNPPYNVKS
jgi:hypothetical protein